MYTAETLSEVWEKPRTRWLHLLATTCWDRL